MRIEAFWAKGYRSLRDLRLESLGPFNVFYGKNGSGKSNILAALQTLCRLIGVIGREIDEDWLRAGGRHLDEPHERVAERMAAAALGAGIVQRRDVALHATDAPMLLGATFEAGPSLIDLAIGRLLPQRVSLQVSLEWAGPQPSLWLSELAIDGRPIRQFDGASPPTPSPKEVRSLLGVRLPARAFSIVDAIRSLRPEPDESAPRTDVPNGLLQDMNEGRLASALFAAKNASEAALRRQFQALQSMLQGPPLSRPPFDVLRDVNTREITVRERLSAVSTDERDVPLDLAGLGVVQIYTILAKILFAGTSAVGVEEPEAHLHAPTSGLHLRQLLRRLVEEGHIEQLFLTTHSNLFDLDPGGYFDVRLDSDGATVVERRPLRDLDRHFYEPGPTLHALEELLGVAPPDKVMFRRPDGSPVTAREMIDLLRGADPIALEYLQNLHAAALDVVGLRSRKEKPA